MARVVYAARAVADLERLIDFQEAQQPGSAKVAVARIAEAVSILKEHPLIGRPAEAGLRELVISRGQTGYVALYRLVAEEDVALVLALWHQREAGFSE